MPNPRNIDIVRYIPESLLSIIVSSLPFEEAVRTSILSKQWRYAWLSTRNIELHEHFFVKPKHSGAKRLKCRLNFLNFVKQWIQMYGEPSAHTFCFSLSNPEPHKDVIWKAINFAYNLKVKVLELDFSNPSWLESYDFYDGLIQLSLSKIRHDIETLKLASVDLELSNSAKTFTSLKILSLSWAKMTTTSLDRILSLCPNLKSLSLKKCKDVGFLVINKAPNLKRLAIEDCNICQLTGILIDIPSLQMFKYGGWPIPFKGDNLESLEAAVLDFSYAREIFGEVDTHLYHHLTGLGSVRDLTIDSYMIQAIQLTEYPFCLKPQLESVRILRLKGAELSYREYYGITFFLSSCPNLESLHIDIEYHDLVLDVPLPGSLDYHPFLMKERDIIPFECVKKTLKEVNVTEYKGGLWVGDDVLMYLLKHGSVLEKMEIYLPKFNWQHYHRLSQHLLKYERASRNVHISFH